MKIIQLSTYRVAPRGLLLKMETDSGIVGWGEPIVEGPACTVETAVHKLSEYLIGKDPARINDLWRTLLRVGFYHGTPILMSAIASMDQALWDIKGKVLGVPVHQLLGGLVRDRMKTYSSIGGDRPAEIIAAIRTRMQAGFDTFKLNCIEDLALIDTPRAVDAAVATLAQIHEAFGSSISYGLDLHGRVSAPMAAVLLRELEPYRPMFVEELLSPEHADHYPRLAAKTSIPLAAGERMYSCLEFKRVLAAGGIAIVQPDLSRAGGITECYKIAAMAQSYGVALAPHCPLGPIALAACLQLDFVASNAVLQEQGPDLFDYVRNEDHFRIDRGLIAPLPLPGLGVEIDEERVIEASRVAEDWRNPIWRLADGSVAAW